MKNKLIKFSINILLIFIIGNTGCIEEEKNEIEPHQIENQTPEINITYPTISQGFDYFYNDTFIIKWKASDENNDELKINLYYSLDNITWHIMTLNESNDGEYSWSIDTDQLLQCGQDLGRFYLIVTSSDGIDESIDTVYTSIGWSFPKDHPEYIELNFKTNHCFEDLQFKEIICYKCIKGNKIINKIGKSIGW